MHLRAGSGRACVATWILGRDWYLDALALSKILEAVDLHHQVHAFVVVLELDEPRRGVRSHGKGATPTGMQDTAPAFLFVRLPQRRERGHLVRRVAGREQ